MDSNWLYRDLFLDEFRTKFPWMQDLLNHPEPKCVEKDTERDDKDALST